MKNFIEILNPDVAIKLTREQAQKLGINPDLEDQRGELKTYGPWNIPVSYKALCLTSYWEGSRRTKTVLIGQRTLTNAKQSGYYIDGQVSVKGKKYSCFTSDQLFEIDGKLINVATIHARI